MSKKTEFERTIEEQLGEPIEQIREMPIDERRRMNEKKHGRPMAFLTFLDNLIGRGNVLRDRTISHEDVEKAVDKALRK